MCVCVYVRLLGDDGLFKITIYHVTSHGYPKKKLLLGTYFMSQLVSLLYSISHIMFLFNKVLRMSDDVLAKYVTTDDYLRVTFYADVTNKTKVGKVARSFC